MRLLFVDCCLSQRGSASRTRQLANAFLDTFRAAHPGAEVETVDLGALALKPLMPDLLDRRDALAQAGAFDDPIFDLARQFQAADRVVVAAPFWDLSYPAQLRIYMEYISACGLCYHYTAAGCVGDCRAERLVYLTSGGDIQRPESIGILHWQQLCAMFGIPSFDAVFAGGMDLDPARTPALLEEACQQARALAETF